MLNSFYAIKGIWKCTSQLKGDIITPAVETWIKGTFSDFNNIFLLHESEDINKKSVFPKFQLIPILHFQVMHD